MAGSNAPKVNYTERRQKVLELRKAGASLRAIAQALNVSHETIRNDIQAVMEDLQKEAVAEAAQYKALELERLDALQTKLWGDAMRGHHGAVDRVLRVMERRAKLLGLDAPTKYDHRFDKDPETLDEAELVEFIAQLKAQIEAR